MDCLRIVNTPAIGELGHRTNMKLGEARFFLRFLDDKTLKYPDFDYYR
jgi:hypothetical protein